MLQPVRAPDIQGQRSHFDEGRRQRPLHHVVVWQRVPSTPGAAVPALYLTQPGMDADETEPLARFVEYQLAHVSMSPTWLLQQARGLGLFHDFLVQHGRSSGLLGAVDSTLLNLANAFGTALRRGTIAGPGPGIKDATGLLWGPGALDSQNRALLRGVSNFIEWLEARNPGAVFDREQLFAEKARKARRNRIPRDADLLAHLHLHDPELSGRDTSEGSAIREELSAPSGVVRFPADKFDALFEHGFKSLKPRSKQEDSTAKLVAMLCAFGGLRCSETLHFWVNDVTFKNGAPLVFMHHPADGKLMLEGGGSVTRMEHLRARYGMLPRNLESGRFRAGWKGVFLGEAGRDQLFWKWSELHRTMFTEAVERYLGDERPRLMRQRLRRGLPDHPFLLVSSGTTNDDDASDGGDMAGDPYSYAALRRGWERAIARVAARTGDPTFVVLKSLGTTLHGLRHKYGGELRDGGMEPAMIRRCLRHRNISSQAPYTAPTAEMVNDFLHRLP